MKPKSLPDHSFSEELTEHLTKLTITTKQYINNDLDHLEDDSGYIFENWKIEPFVGFKITMEDGSYLILTKPEEFKQFGITLFEHSTSEFEPENDCNV
jgi:hypothetical protein